MGRVALQLLVVFISGAFSLPTFAQAVGGGGSGGGGLSTRIAARNPGCTEERQSIFMERNPITNEDMAVVKTCLKGTYYDLTKYVYEPKVECKREGARYIQEKRKRSSGKVYYMLGYCREGKVVVVGEAPPHMVIGLAGTGD